MENKLVKAKKDTSLHSTLDINNILSNAPTVSTMTTTRPYLEGKTMLSISKDVEHAVNSIPYFYQEHKDKLISVLFNQYILIENLCDLQNSYYLRLIPKDPSKKKTGGTLVGVKFLSTGTDILVLSGKRILQYKFDNYYIFMKLKQEDLLILLLNI